MTPPADHGPSDHAVIEGRTVTASTVVAEPAAAVFALLADPHRHHEDDGSVSVDHRGHGALELLGFPAANARSIRDTPRRLVAIFGVP